MTDLFSIEWWLSVVFVGGVLNILSAYAKNALDRRLQKISTWRQDLAHAREQLREKQLARLRTSEHAQLLVSVREVRARIRALGYGIVGALAFALAGFATSGLYCGEVPQQEVMAMSVILPVVMAVGVASMIIGLSHHRMAVRLSQLLNVANLEELVDFESNVTA
jgi:hypothetical protein